MLKLVKKKIIYYFFILFGNITPYQLLQHINSNLEVYSIDI